MLKSIELVHIGDVHYPDAKKEKLGDIKDSAFPSVVAELARLKPLTCVARALTAATEKRGNALVLTGDLTSFGDSSGYRDCLDFLNELLNLKRWSMVALPLESVSHD